MNSAKILRLIVSVGVCQLAGIIGGLFTASSVSTWYSGIEKPVFNPPNWIFGPVWITLYFIMGVALYLVWDTEAAAAMKKNAIILFSVQLILNVLWSYCFFYLRSPLLGLIEITVLLVFILLATWWFFKIRPLAGYLMIPYIMWVSFATLLNVYLWKLNR